jgi:hypothetical protein
MTYRTTTTLWDLVSSLQEDLGGCGLDDETVDAAVVIGVGSLFGAGRRAAPATGRDRAAGSRFRLFSLFGSVPAVGKA